jgi:hypothetical protein
MDKLAQELVDQLIDALYVADPDGMKASGLVYTHWVARSRYNLFAKVSVYATRLLPFVEIVSSSQSSPLSGTCTWTTMASQDGCGT